MINKWNMGKPWCRLLSVMMALALTITLLSGCGTSGGTQEKRKNKQENLLQEEVELKRSELADISKQMEETVSRLEREVEQKSGSAAEDTVKTLKEQLVRLEERTSDWLVAQKNVERKLSGKAEKTLKERNRRFKKQLAANREQAEQALEGLEHALAEDDPAKANEQSEILKKLLMEETEPKTYGENLPGEAEIYEPEERELTSITEAKPEKEEPQTLTKAELSELLVTEGDTELNDELKGKAKELATPLAVYHFLKNNIGYEYYYGSRKGAAGTYSALAGNDLDQASLLIAMLRYLGCEAEYVRGSIYLTEEQAVALTGADDIIHASNILAAAGTPVVRLIQNGRVEKISIEHVWVRAHIPYTDYRGAGNAGGSKVWIDLDTGIKAYEEVENLYDTLEKEGFQKEIEEAVKAGNAAGLETMLDQWEEQITSMDTETLYAVKRIIKHEELSYLPLSLQYEVQEEKETFAQTNDKDKDRICFEVEGNSLGTYTASELAGKNILLSFRPASDEDKEILEAYDSVFDIPAYSVYMKPVLLINGEVAAEAAGEGTTLGTSQTFTMKIRSGGRDTEVENTVTTGSMYAVTLDNQNITGGELQDIYDETAALKDSVTGENVYSEEYLGRLLSLAGKLYFAQVDIADRIAAELYDVNSTRSLSEGITGYEVRTTSLYGTVTGIAEGSLYIDVDTDTHSVVSLNGDKDAPREYMFSTGMISSLYESTVWEELTGYESVSTISILAKAQEENIDILLISKANLDTEIKKLNTDDTTRQVVINAVNSGKVVTIPAEDVIIGEWHGTGYIVANPETGAGEYMICGGLNGGSVVVSATLTFLAGLIYTIVELTGLFFGVLGIVELLIGGAFVLPVVLLVLTGIAMCVVVDRYINWQSDYMDYLLDGNVDAAFEMMYEFANDVGTDAKITAVFGMSQIILRYLVGTYGKAIREVLPDLSEYIAKLEDLRKLLPEKYQKVDSEGNKIGNIAYSVSNIKDYNIGEMKSFSQYGNIKENGIINKVEGWISNILNGRYRDDVLKVNSHKQIDAVNGYLRINDTEYKIIENYNQILKGDYNASGIITIVSERTVCPSCDNVIKKFSGDYKNIEIRVVDSKGSMYKVKGGVVQ